MAFDPPSSDATALPTSVGERVRRLFDEVAVACRAAGRSPAAVAVCAVSKGQPRAAVVAAIDAGVREIGESYVQEAGEKLRDLPDAIGGAGAPGSRVRRHFIGHVQTNKARRIVELFDVVQSVDRLDAGRALARAADGLGKPLTVLVQVNVAADDRYGVAPDDAPALAAALRELGLRVDGVMAIGPNPAGAGSPTGADRLAIIRSFEEAARVFAQVGGSTLSIGMSSDWREAVACGSTMVRIGTAIFGPRPPVRRRDRPTAAVNGGDRGGESTGGRSRITTLEEIA